MSLGLTDSYGTSCKWAREEARLFLQWVRSAAYRHTRLRYSMCMAYWVKGRLAERREKAAGEGVLKGTPNRPWQAW